MLVDLWRSRDRPPFASRAWCVAWAKRIRLLPVLFRQRGIHARLRRRGATIARNAFLSADRKIEGTLDRLTVGEEFFVGRVQIAVHDEVHIGRRVCINDGAKLLTATHDIADPAWPTISSPIRIGDYAWIATSAIILPGVTIGEGAAVGAGAVVARDVPACAVVVGNPARALEKTRHSTLDYNPVAGLALARAWRHDPARKINS